MILPDGCPVVVLFVCMTFPLPEFFRNDNDRESPVRDFPSADKYFLFDSGFAAPGVPNPDKYG